MIIEVRNAGFLNKGAELMLLAIVGELRKTYPDATLTMVPSAPNSSQPVDRLAGLGFYPKSSLIRLGIELGDLAALIPQRLRRRYGLVLDREVDVVIDAAGFAYSDQWGAASTLRLARAARRWRRRGTRLILMPQAFGPFSRPEIRSAIRKTVDNATLVMPRDSTSYRHLTEVTGERDSIRRFPDFTNLVNGVVPDWFDPDEYGVAVVPNARMLDMTDDGTSSRYLPFLGECIRRLTDRGGRPFLLVHEGASDERLAQRVSGSSGNIPIVREDNPLKIKGILGASRAVVASRFHALVSALSQGVPAIATGWSHKYGELFQDYDFPEGVLPDITDTAHIALMVDRIVNPDSRSAIATGLLSASTRLKRQSEEMWAGVHAVIGDPAAPVRSKV